MVDHVLGPARLHGIPSSNGAAAAAREPARVAEPVGVAP
jgi:hypothetical protein